MCGLCKHHVTKIQKGNKALWFGELIHSIGSHTCSSIALAKKSSATRGCPGIIVVFSSMFRTASWIQRLPFGYRSLYWATAAGTLLKSLNSAHRDIKMHYFNCTHETSQNFTLHYICIYMRIRIHDLRYICICVPICTCVPICVSACAHTKTRIHAPPERTYIYIQVLSTQPTHGLEEFERSLKTT